MRLSQHLGLLLLSTIAAISAHAEDGAEGWLRYAPIIDTTRYASLPSQIVVLGNTPTDQAAANELQRGLTAMLGRPFTIAHETEDLLDLLKQTSGLLLQHASSQRQANIPSVSIDKTHAQDIFEPLQLLGHRRL